MKHSARLLFLGCVVLMLGACATQWPRPPQVADPSTDTQRKDCLRETGTRVKVPEGRCANANGTVYTAEDIERSGAQTLGEVLRRVRR